MDNQNDNQNDNQYTEQTQQTAQPPYDQQPQYSQYGYQPQYGYPPRLVVPGKGLAIASMVLGVISLSLFWIPIFNFIFAICAIVGIVLGAVAKNKGFTGGMATAGVVCSIIALALIVIYYIYVCGETCSACNKALYYSNYYY